MPDEPHDPHANQGDADESHADGDDPSQGGHGGDHAHAPDHEALGPVDRDGWAAALAGSALAGLVVVALLVATQA